ncbi:hypothetical protein AB6A40_003627 [Gnathostoma spinigerum]|uniref:Uncharacterized protein n=1 Tax=Gnathostoma spinigerum TaxID=75299 RepID=A0ABD6EIW9_9BILA
MKDGSAYFPRRKDNIYRTAVPSKTMFYEMSSEYVCRESATPGMWDASTKRFRICLPEGTAHHRQNIVDVNEVGGIHRALPRWDNITLCSMVFDTSLEAEGFPGR